VLYNAQNFLIDGIITSKTKLYFTCLLYIYSSLVANIFSKKVVKILIAELNYRFVKNLVRVLRNKA
jgi:hypothetical protein